MDKKIETGVMILGQDGLYWGNVGKNKGWTTLTNASIHDLEYCKKPSDVTYDFCPHKKELEEAVFVKVTRTTAVFVEFHKE